ncbi:MAG: DUF308 domain-containing protein [Oscillospiraceae bacterium]|nr:DUF308 domain-containing protein [Oscillospiraceae bacterium]
MRRLSTNFSIVLLALFEGIVGFMLFGNPEKFTRSVIIFFGIIMLIIGAGNLIQALRTRVDGAPDSYMMIAAAADLIIGIVLTLGNKFVYGIFPVVAVIYGIFLIIVGIHKLRVYRGLKREGFMPPILSLVSGLSAIVLGILIVLNPFGTVETLWKFAGVVLIGEAVLDLLAFFK